MIWAEHRDYDNYDTLASFQPNVKLEPERIAYLKAGEPFMVRLKADRNKSSNSREILGSGPVTAIVYADMDGGIVSESYGEFYYLKAGKERHSTAGTGYINVRTPNFEKKYANKYTNFTIYADEIDAIYVSHELAAKFTQRNAKYVALRDGSAQKRAALAAQAEIDKARQMIRDAEKMIADAQKNLG